MNTQHTKTNIKDTNKNEDKNGNKPGLSGNDGTPVAKSLNRQLAQDTNAEGLTNLEGCLGTHLQSLQIGTATDDESSVSSQASHTMQVDSETEARLLEEEPKGTGTRAAKRKNKSERTEEEKSKNGYRRSLQFLRKMDAKDPLTLSARDKMLMKKHRKSVAKFDRKMDPGKGGQQQPHDKATRSPPRQTTEAKQTLSKAATATSIVKTGKDGEQQPKATRYPPSQTKMSRQTLPFVATAAAAKSKPGTSAEQPASSKQTVKRIRSGEEVQREPKKLKPSVSFNSPLDLQVAIVDRSDPDGKIARDKWLEIEMKILHAMLKEEGGDDGIDFDGAKWQKGVKVVGCGNRKSLDFLTRTINGLCEPWPGARLEVISRSSLPLRQLISIWIPPPIPDNESFLKLIGRQNKDLDTQCWRIISSATGKRGTGKDFLITVDQKSLEKLRENMGRFKFGLGSLKAKLPIINDSTRQREATGGAD